MTIVEMTFKDFVELFIVATIANVVITHPPLMKKKAFLSCNMTKVNNCRPIGFHQSFLPGSSCR